MLDGEIERRAISASLAAGDNLQACKQFVIHSRAYTLNTTQIPERTDDAVPGGRDAAL
jgi:hypothetical protein